MVAAVDHLGRGPKAYLGALLAILLLAIGSGCNRPVSDAGSRATAGPTGPAPEPAKTEEANMSMQKASGDSAVRDALAGFRVGHWTHQDGTTGCTVVLAPEGTVGAVDVRG